MPLIFVCKTFYFYLCDCRCCQILLWLIRFHEIKWVWLLIPHKKFVFLKI